MVNNFTFIKKIYFYFKQLFLNKKICFNRT